MYYLVIENHQAGEKEIKQFYWWLAKWEYLQEGRPYLQQWAVAKPK
jgi:hypothetical protein